MLSDGRRDEFERTGILKVEGAFAAPEAERMQAAVWGELRHRYGIERGDRSTWDRHPPTGLKSAKRSSAFDPIIGPVVAGVLDDLFGTGGWVRPKTMGNVLVTMPDAATWRLPHRIWHSDFEADQPTGRLFAVKVWALVDDVDPGGAGTPLLAGSHRLFARWLDAHPERRYKEAKEAFLRSHPYLRALSTDDGDPDRNRRFMDAESDVDGVPARVIECTGAAGDVYVTHGWVFHTIAPNATDRPRLMRGAAVMATSLA
jgi:ectoine hydroxylase-related dioxygenase (phytanoyl-CoA dioxygenase family)